jgi:hypothetical protein
LRGRHGPEISDEHVAQEPKSTYIYSIYTSREKKMPQSPHNRIAELHNLAAHAHSAAAVAHGKGDHLSAHDLSKQALEHSMNAHKLSDELTKKAAKSGKA